MPLPVVSALTAGILIIVQMALLYAVVRARRSNRQSLGDGGKGELLRAIRRHGNFAENAAIFVAGFALLELMGVGRIEIAVLCGVFVAARVAHIVGLSMKRSTVNPLRIGGTAVTVFVGVALGLRLIVCAIRLLTA